MDAEVLAESMIRMCERCESRKRLGNPTTEAKVGYRRTLGPRKWWSRRKVEVTRPKLETLQKASSEDGKRFVRYDKHTSNNSREPSHPGTPPIRLTSVEPLRRALEDDRDTILRA